MSKELLRRIRRHVANVDVQDFKTNFQPFFYFLDEFYFRWLGSSIIEIGKTATIP